MSLVTNTILKSTVFYSCDFLDPRNMWGFVSTCEYLIANIFLLRFLFSLLSITSASWELKHLPINCFWQISPVEWILHLSCQSDQIQTSLLVGSSKKLLSDRSDDDSSLGTRLWKRFSSILQSLVVARQHWESGLFSCNLYLESEACD